MEAATGVVVSASVYKEFAFEPVLTGGANSEDEWSGMSGLSSEWMSLYALRVVGPTVCTPMVSTAPGASSTVGTVDERGAGTVVM